MSQSPRFNVWLRRAILLCTDDGPCSRLVLSHGKSSGAALLVNQWPIADGPDPERLTADVWDAAVAYAEVFQGTQLFDVAAFYGKAAAPGARFVLRVDGRPTVDVVGSELAPTEEATSRGVAAQAMRHAEAIMRTHVGSLAVIASTLQGELQAKAARISELEDRQLDVYRLLEQLTTQREERAAHARQAEREDKREAMIAEKINLLVPVIANRIAGVKVFPTPATESEHHLKALISTLSAEQLAGIASKLDPTQAIALFELIDRFLPKTDSKALPAGSNGTGASGAPPTSPGTTGKGGATH